LFGFILLLALVDSVALNGFIIQLVLWRGREIWVVEIPNQLSFWGKEQMLCEFYRRVERRCIIED
jgi:hypothetical protein